MAVLVIILFVCAALCALLAVPGNFAGNKINLVALSLFFGFLALLIQVINAVA